MKKLFITLLLIQLFNCKQQCVYEVLKDKKVLGNYIVCRYYCEEYNSFPPIYHKLIYSKTVQLKFCQPDNFVEVMSDNF